MVRSRVEYGSLVWSLYTKQFELEMIQRTAASWVKTIPHMKVSPECLMTWVGGR